jgi:MFS transporter, DHA1 family, chloramphenicol resistance protein
MVENYLPPVRTRRLPLGVYLLAVSLFAMGSSEFLLAGVLPRAADDLRVSLASAGSLISAFALGVVLGGPPLAILTLRWPRRMTLLASQALFAGSVAVFLLAGQFWVLLAARFVSGVAYAGFFAVAAVTSVSLVTPERTARASGVVVSGLGISMIAGGPAGTLLSHFTGWRGGFWGVVALTAASAIAIAVALPPTSPGTPPDVRREWRSMRQPRLWLVYLSTILSTSAYMITFNYLAAILTRVTGLPEVWVPAVLSLFGIGAFAGLTIGGRIADRRPHLALTLGAAGILVSSALFALLANQPVLATVLVFGLGIAGFVLNPAIYKRVFTLAGQAPTLAGAVTVSAFQLGISLTPALAGDALSTGAQLTSVAWIGAGLAALTLLTARLDAARRWWVDKVS